MKRKHLKIGPTPGDDFEMLLFVLTQEVSFALLHLKVAHQIAKTSSDKPRSLHVAPTFFALTFRAHIESAYARAARLFDPRTGTATVSSMVREAEKKAGTFKYAKPSEVRDKVKLWDKKIASLRPLLSKLHNLRNDLIAHLNADVILDPQEMKKTIGVTFDEIELILNLARDVVNAALDAYANSMYVDELESVKDYESLLSILERSSGVENT